MIAVGILAFVTGPAVLRQSLQVGNRLGGVMAFATGRLLVLPGKDKSSLAGGLAVVKVRETIQAIVAGEAVAREILLVVCNKFGLVSSVAVHAQGCFGLCEGMRMAVSAGKDLPIHGAYMASKRKTQGIMRETG